MSVYSRAKGLKPRRSRFNVGYMKGYDCDAGQLIPSMVKYMVPGDIFRFSQEVVARAIEPLKAPAMSEFNIYTMCFFVPLRILFGSVSTDKDGWYEWNINDHDFEKFITGGRLGNDTTVSIPRWEPTGSDVVNDNWNGIEPPGEGEDPNGSNKNDANVTVADNGKYSLWDYLEYPVDVIPAGAFPADFKKRCYNLIYNEWIRDENVMPPVHVINSNIVLNCTWKKDYFTSMLPWPQRGDPVAVPMRGDADVSLNIPAVAPVVYTSGIPAVGQLGLFADNHKIGTSVSVGDLSAEGVSAMGNTGSVADMNLNRKFIADLTGITGSAALSLAASFTVNDLRLAFQIQRWQELNAKCGSRYVEFLKANYGCSPTDDTLQRPMFIGGYKSPVIISEVLQTSEGGTGVGSMSGHAIAADGNFVTKFRANEFGIMMALTTIRPKAMYHQGIDREDLYRSRLEFFNPVFVNLGEQLVERAEIFADNSGNVKLNGDPEGIGFQGRYNELRSSHNKVCGGLRDQLGYWVSKRTFDTAPELNGQFLKCNPSKEIFSVLNEPAFIVMVNNKIPAYRPLPIDPQPGLIDHIYGERR